MNKTYIEIARLMHSMLNCEDSGKESMAKRHKETLFKIVKDTGPSGSGFDCGTKLLLDDSSRDKLVFSCGFHHMDDNGYYTQWTSHKITVKPDLLFGFTLTISGPNKNDIKEYIHETLEYWLNTDIDIHEFYEKYDTKHDKKHDAQAIQ